LKGYTGKILIVNLTEKDFWTETIPDDTLKKFIGGRGLGAKLLYDMIEPGIDPLGPENIFVLMTGPLTGTLIPGSCKYALITKSPATGGFLDAYSSSRISGEIKYAGYDAIVFKGKSDNPVYVYIEDERVYFKDAEHLMGKDNFETEDQIRRELNDNKVGIITVGPAAEKMVKISLVNSDYYRQAARGGGGAVVASKNMKAVAVKGNGSVQVDKFDKIMDQQFKYYEYYNKNEAAKRRSKYGTPLTIDVNNPAGMLPTRNFQTGQFPEAEGTIDTESVQKVVQKTKACYGCISPCGKMTKADKGEYKDAVVEGPEYETLGLLGSNLGMTDLSFVIKANEICDRLGIDTISAGVIVSFAMECKEKGILSKEDLNNLDLEFGKPKEALQLIKDIANRNGIGDLLAEGVKYASEKIGKGTDKFAMHIKGLELPGYDPRAGWGTALAYAVNPRGGCHRRAWPPAHEILGDYEPFTIEGKPELIQEMYNENGYFHCLILCDFTRFVPVTGNPYKDFDKLIDHYAQYLTWVTGEKFTSNDLWDLSERTETQIRLFNNREGFTSEDDTLPDRLLNEPLPDGPPAGKVITKERLEKMKRKYYELRGWDHKGRPTDETLKKLNIER